MIVFILFLIHGVLYTIAMRRHQENNRKHLLCNHRKNMCWDKDFKEFLIDIKKPENKPSGEPEIGKYKAIDKDSAMHDYWKDKEYLDEAHEILESTTIFGEDYLD